MASANNNSHQRLSYKEKELKQLTGHCLYSNRLSNRKRSNRISALPATINHSTPRLHYYAPYGNNYYVFVPPLTNYQTCDSYVNNSKTLKPTASSAIEPSPVVFNSSSLEHTGCNNCNERNGYNNHHHHNNNNNNHHHQARMQQQQSFSSCNCGHEEEAKFSTFGVGLIAVNKHQRHSCAPIEYTAVPIYPAAVSFSSCPCAICNDFTRSAAADRNVYTSSSSCCNSDSGLASTSGSTNSSVDISNSYNNSSDKQRRKRKKSHSRSRPHDRCHPCKCADCCSPPAYCFLSITKDQHYLENNTNGSPHNLPNTLRQRGTIVPPMITISVPPNCRIVRDNDNVVLRTSISSSCGGATSASSDDCGEISSTLSDLDLRSSPASSIESFDSCESGDIFCKFLVPCMGNHCKPILCIAEKNCLLFCFLCWIWPRKKSSAFSLVCEYKFWFVISCSKKSWKIMSFWRMSSDLMVERSFLHFGRIANYNEKLNCMNSWFLWGGDYHLILIIEIIELCCYS